MNEFDLFMGPYDAARVCERLAVAQQTLPSSAPARVAIVHRGHRAGFLAVPVCMIADAFKGRG